MSWLKRKARSRRTARLERQNERIKRELRPGSFSTQYNVCGSPGCRCKTDPPKKHSPYYQISYTRKGKSSSRFVRNGDLAAELSTLRLADKSL